MVAVAKRSYTPKDPQIVNLMTLFEDYGSEDRCRVYLEELRWPSGLRCPRCDASKGISRVKGRGYECESCGYKYSVLAGTIFHDTKLPLTKWFAAAYLMTESRKGISANQMKRTLGVSYKTAWYLCHRIRAAMADANPEPLTGVVEVDETYVGGHRKGGRGRWNGENKTMVMGAVERGGEIRLKVEVRADRRTVQRFIGANVDGVNADAIYTDGHQSYEYLNATGLHGAVDHNKDEWVRGDVHTQTIESVWSLLKRSIVGSYHQLSAKHLDAYLDEMEWRFNNRENPYLFRDTMIALITSDNLTYQALIS